MQRKFWIVAFLLLPLASCVAETPKPQKPPKPVDLCQAKPGDTTINLPLQGGTASFEPVCEPYRIRVKDRQPVTIVLTNVSPVEVCLPSSKAPAITTVTNPFESIINTIAGFKSFDFASHNMVDFNNQVDFLNPNLRNPPPPPPGPPPPPPPPPTADEAALKIFTETANKVYRSAKAVTDKQIAWQAQYQTDLDNIALYIAADYRAGNYKNFDPDNDPQLDDVRTHSTLSSIVLDAAVGPNDPPSEMDYAPLQALIDEMKSTQTRFVTACNTVNTACNAETLRRTYHLLDDANAIMSVIQDNMKSLQTAQAAVATSFAVLHKIRQDYDRKIKAGTLVVSKDGVLTQNIVLATDYGATDTGTISCATDTTPVVATTDTINFSILYQNVPALTMSAGLFITFLEKDVYGVVAQFNPGSVCTTTCMPPTPTFPTGTYTQYFALTDSARASVFPMAFVNFRVAPPLLKRYWGEPNSELIVTQNLSAGIGVNSNTGTNQPEFFGGYAAGFNRVLIHAGLHYGRVQSLGGGFTPGQAVPASWGNTATPINWNYKPYVGIGFSVRLAPW
jgi:hypothetical protein